MGFWTVPQYKMRQDHLTDILLKCCKNTENNIDRKQKDEYFAGRKNKNKLIKKLPYQEVLIPNPIFTYIISNSII